MLSWQQFEKSVTTFRICWQWYWNYAVKFARWQHTLHWGAGRCRENKKQNSK